MSTLPTQEKAFVTRLLSWFTAVIAVGLLSINDIQLVRAAYALSIADFVGHFRGEAQVQAGDRFFIQQLRDAEVLLARLMIDRAAHGATRRPQPRGLQAIERIDLPLEVWDNGEGALEAVEVVVRVLER